LGPPAIEGGFVLTTRGGDFELDIGHDISIGYSICVKPSAVAIRALSFMTRSTWPRYSSNREIAA
jgi:uncharacterized linocin/CFP29 family protein